MIHFSNSFYQWLNEQAGASPIARLITKAHNLGHIYPAYSRILTDSEINYITMRGDGMLSYLPAGKEHKTNDRGDWSRDNRQMGKPAKVIRKVFTERALRFIKPQAFESFGNAYKAKFVDNGYKFELFDRTHIKGVYDMQRAEGEASLNGSCMNGDSNYLEIYAKCKYVNILTLTNKAGQLCGRALVWKLEYNDAPITFMDRIYVVEDYMYDLFLNYAQEQKWWRKRDYKTFDNKRSWINPETDEVQTMIIEIETPTDFNRYPYIDTFAYGEDGTLTNNSDATYTYNETNGARDGGDNEEEGTYDEINDDYISDDDAVYLSHLGEGRFRDRTTYIGNAVQAIVSGRNTEWFHQDDSNVVELYGPSGHRYYYTGHDDVIRRVDGEYDHIDNCVMCETDSEYYESDDSDLLEDGGNYYHKHDDDDVVYVQGNGKQGIAGEFKYLPSYEGEIVKATDGNHYWSHDDRITQVVDDEDSAWFVIEHDSPRMILQVDGLWHHRADVADVTVLDCDTNGKQTKHTEHYLQSDQRITFVTTPIGKSTRKECGWYLKRDLLKYRGRYYRKDDQRLLVRVLRTLSTRKAQTV